MLKKMPLFVFLLLVSWNLNAKELEQNFLSFNFKTSPPVANDLPYGESKTEVTSHINEYDAIAANKPLSGSIFITHDKNENIDEKSFFLGDKPLKAVFVKSEPTSTASPLIVTIYNFQLEGLPLGEHTLAPINVIIGGKKFYAHPLVIEVLK